MRVPPRSVITNRYEFTASDGKKGAAGTMTRLTVAVETYLAELGQVRASGGATGERSSYPALAGLLTAAGATLKPKVICVSELADQGAGHPDFGLYAAKQLQKSQPKDGQLPERGVVEVKSANDDAWLTAASQQVSRYWEPLPPGVSDQYARFRAGRRGCGWPAGHTRNLPAG